MAIRYVKNTGSNTSPYDTWAKAATTLQTAITGAVAGDIIYVASNHSQSGTSVAIAPPVSPAVPLYIISVDSTGSPEPPTTLQAGAVIELNLNGGNLTIIGSAYFWGITFRRTGGTSGNIHIDQSTNASWLEFVNCTFYQVTGQEIIIGNNPSTANDFDWIRLRDCTIQFDANNNAISCRYGNVQLQNCTLAGAPASHGSLFNINAAGHNYDTIIEGCDFSGGTYTVLISRSGSTIGQHIFKNCKLRNGIAYWSGTLAGPGGHKLKIENCSHTDGTIVRIYHDMYEGTIQDETTIVMTDGASDGTTPISWKYTTTANARDVRPLGETLEIVSWEASTGSPVTKKVEIITDNVTLNDNEAWIEVFYLGTSASMLGSYVTNRIPALTISTPTNHPSSSQAWTTTGLTTPVKQSMSVTFTPQTAGFYALRVFLAKPSTTMYVNPQALAA